VAELSIKRQLAVRVAEATGLSPEKVDLVVRGLCEEMLRTSNEQLRSRGGNLFLQGVGRFWATPSRRGARNPGTGAAAPPHWAFWFRPHVKLISRCAEICSE
jgi:nucleoid DNA-binding protein